MPNSQLTKDRLMEALCGSLVKFFEADLVAAWGGDVEVALGTPEFDYERREKADGSTEARDLSVRPLAVVVPLTDVGGPWGISPRNDEMLRSARFRLNLAAASTFDILALQGTAVAVMDGAASGTGGIPLLSPADWLTVLDTVYFDDQVRLAGLFGGPGENAQESAALPEGHGQFGNLKHRAAIVFGIDTKKPRGSAVV